MSCRVGVGLLLAGLASPGRPAELPPWPFLRDAIKLSDGQLQDVQKGEVVTKQLPSPEKQEIAAFGIVKIAGEIATLRERMRDFQKFRQVPQIPEAGRFSDDPSAADLAGLTWPDDDYDALAHCKPGKCDVKMGTAGLERIQKEGDWKAADARTRATAIIKELLASYARAHKTGGNDAMGVVGDKRQPKALAQEFRTLVGNSTYLVDYVPEFNRHLLEYPNDTLENTTDALIWTKDTFGLKPVVSIYHVTVHEPADGTPSLLAAIK